MRGLSGLTTGRRQAAQSAEGTPRRLPHTPEPAACRSVLAVKQKCLGRKSFKLPCGGRRRAQSQHSTLSTAALNFG